MSEQRLIDANELEYCIEYLRPELEECRDSVQRCVEVFSQYVGNQPTIDHETLPIVRELRDENLKAECRADALMAKILVLEENLKQVTAERDAAIVRIRQSHFGMR